MARHWTTNLPEAGEAIRAIDREYQEIHQEIARLKRALVFLEEQAERETASEWSKTEIKQAKLMAAEHETR